MRVRLSLGYVFSMRIAPRNHLYSLDCNNMEPNLDLQCILHKLLVYLSS